MAGETKAEAYAVIGKHIPRMEGIVKSKGEAIYTADFTLPGTQYGKILPYPHARIIGIDTSKAEKLKGVKAVNRGRDIPG